MAKNRGKTRIAKPLPVLKAGSRVPVASEPAPGKLRFSFRFLTITQKFDPAHCGAAYAGALLLRLKALEQTATTDFVTQIDRKGLRSHPIDFAEPRVSEDGWGDDRLPEGRPWQFSVSANEHGRVHGILTGDVFYVIWIDPLHRLFP